MSHILKIQNNCDSKQRVDNVHNSVIPPCPCSSKPIIVPMATDCLTDRLGPEPIQSVNVNLLEPGTQRYV